MAGGEEIAGVSDLASGEAGVVALTGDPIVNEAKRRFDRCAEWEGNWRTRFIDDVMFANGDSDNSWQWPNAIRTGREGEKKPCLTINLTAQHNLQIINSYRKSKYAGTVRGVGDGATADSAEMFKQLIRHIEYQSDAQAAYILGGEYQVQGGQGVWRIVTDFAGPDSFDQEIFIRRMVDPLSVYFDPDCETLDGSDGKFAFVFDLVQRSEFNEAYPKFAGLGDLQPMGVSTHDSDWAKLGHIRICEYFRKVKRPGKLLRFLHPKAGTLHVMHEKELGEPLTRFLLDDPQTQWRTVEDEEVEWHLIVGDEIVDSTIWLGKYIPLIRCLGIETRINGELDRKGHTRAMKDAQRMLNYHSSAQVEFVALQGKTPWVAPAQAIEDYETYWNSANTTNHSVLPYNHRDDEGNDIPPPQRTTPPQLSDAYQRGMDTAFNQLMMASGQWQNQMGMGGNERTGEAIAQRQDQSDNATFHFPDNYFAAIRYTTKQLLDLIPRVYSSRRIVQIQGDDGEMVELEIDPTQKQAYDKQLAEDGAVARHILNPAVGRYDVMADAAPAMGTRRDETVKAMTLILTQNPALVNVIGDLLLASMDFDKAQEAAKRLRNLVPAQALGEGPTPQEQQLQAQVQALQNALAEALEKSAKDRLKLTGKDQMRDIDAYKAETDRMKALADAMPGVDPAGLMEVVHQLVADAMQTNLSAIPKANAQGVQDQGGQEDDSASGSASSSPSSSPPVPGAQQAPDGNFYVPDPTRQGGWMRVVVPQSGGR